jgi:hypothetical protein
LVYGKVVNSVPFKHGTSMGGKKMELTQSVEGSGQFSVTVGCIRGPLKFPGGRLDTQVLGAMVKLGLLYESAVPGVLTEAEPVLVTSNTRSFSSIISFTFAM